MATRYKTKWRLLPFDAATAVIAMDTSLAWVQPGNLARLSFDAATAVIAMDTTPTLIAARIRACL